MDILFASTELSPYVKVGGLADVVSALPKALRALGHKVTVVLPRYAAFESSGLQAARRLTPLPITLGDRVVQVTVYDARLPTQVDLILVDAPGLFDRAGVYGERGEDYPDNALRFALLSRATAEIARLRAAQGQPFDVVHGHDWPTALVPAHLRALVHETPALAATKSVLTVHNLAHQGTFPKDVLPSLGLGWEDFSIDGIEFYGGLNVLKFGLLTADAVTTVSTTYAREIQTPELGYKLDGVLRDRGAKGEGRARGLVGITNGVDYAVWNPATDTALAARYDAEDAANKARCKAALRRELGLAVDVEAPLVASVGRLVHQKGSDLLATAIPRLLRATNAQIVVAGDGDAVLVDKIAQACSSAAAHGRAVFARAASEPLAHRIFAGADLVLVPSRFEPCGLVQLYAQRYGALPVVRATGGLVDTVVDCDAKLETGTGFVFEEPTEMALVGAVERGLAARAGHAWSALVRRVMRLDRGWDRPARQYEQVYRAITAR